MEEQGGGFSGPTEERGGDNEDMSLSLQAFLTLTFYMRLQRTDHQSFKSDARKAER